MDRIYNKLLNEHFINDRQMAFVAGPRQVGKTTTCRFFTESLSYLNYDLEDDRLLILEGPKAIVEKLGLGTAGIIVFDELHKFPNWKNFLKGFFDEYSQIELKIIVTGSARFDIYRKGADSLMGRYFIYRMHPLSVSEINSCELRDSELISPTPIDEKDYQNLLNYGGFPEPFLKANKRFYNKWSRLKKQLLIQQDLRDIAHVQEVAQVELLSDLLQHQSGQLCNNAALAKKIRAAEPSIARWIKSLEMLYFCFLVRPWTNNITNSLLKQPKVYLWDWSSIKDPGAKHENMIASHLLKSIHWWQDNGFGEYELYYIRTKDKREVDFLVSKDSKPWFLVEVKSSEHKPLSKNLEHFQSRTGAKHAFQVTIDGDYSDTDCFNFNFPIKVPAKTFLSQLV